jgi:hypothetical protein
MELAYKAVSEWCEAPHCINMDVQSASPWNASIRMKTKMEKSMSKLTEHVDSKETQETSQF